jgi:DNA-binding LytR/AlgR family response regulator
LLLDDELPGLTYLKLLCEQLPELEVVRAYNNPEIFLQELPALAFDLCILDIEMPGTNGLQIAAQLKGTPVIFTTAYTEFAADAFDLDAVDYVRKPITKERLQQAVQKVGQRINKTEPSKKNFVQLNTDKGKTLLFFDTIGYISASETDSRDKLVRLTDGHTLTLKNISFEKLEGVLPGTDFCRINKKQMIALKSVQYFSHDQITTGLADSAGKFLVLTLNEIYRTDFLKKVKL